MYIQIAVGFNDGVLVNPIELNYDQSKAVCRRAKDMNAYVFSGTACALSTIDKLIEEIGENLSGFEVSGAYRDMDVAYVVEEILKRGKNAIVPKDYTFNSEMSFGDGLDNDIRLACYEHGIDAFVFSDKENFYFLQKEKHSYR